jgi:predicted nucleotidyltransferase
VPERLPAGGDQTGGDQLSVAWKKGIPPDDALFQEIVRRITAVSKPRRIIVFGSAATGAMTIDSDIDLLIIFDAISDRLQMMRFLRYQLRELGYPFDVLVMESNYFEETKDIIGGIAFPASHRGRILYESS